MLRRIFDFVFSLIVLLASSPVMLAAILLVWLYDRHSPFYFARRVGRGGVDFWMLKIRSMRVNADRVGGSSTSSVDSRITPIGRYIRRFKLDELSQFWNVIRGDMSVVGPRPQIRDGGVALYTAAEMKLLSVKPGITDFSSIVFSDEGEILMNCADPDVGYDRLIRPWKSRLGLVYIAHSSILLDIRIIWLTCLSIASKTAAREGVVSILKGLGVDPFLVSICERQGDLPSGLPPGSDAAG